MSEAMSYKLPLLPEPDHTHDRGDQLFYRPDQMQAYAIAAIEAQGMPDGLLNVLDNFEKKERSPFQAYLAAGLVNELRTAMLASAPPAPPADKYVPCQHCGKNTASDNPSQWCPCPKQASVVQQESVAWLYTSPAGRKQAFTGEPKERFRSECVPLYLHPAPQAKPLPLSADRDARIAELERELEKEKQYVKEMTKDHDHRMTVAAERALLLDKNRKVNKPLSDYEFDEIG